MKHYYVIARDGAEQRTIWLCGPFSTYLAALMMVEPVRLAARRTDDPRFTTADFTVSSGKRSRATMWLDLVLDDVISASRPIE